MKRYCRDCKCLLPESRYFNCYTCRPNLSSVEDDMVYMGSDNIDYFGDASDEWEDLDVNILSEDKEVSYIKEE